MDYAQLIHRALELPDAVTDTHLGHFDSPSREVVAALIVAKRGEVGGPFDSSDIRSRHREVVAAGHAVIETVIAGLSAGRLDFLLAGVEDYLPELYGREVIERKLVDKVDSDLRRDEVERMVASVVDAVIGYVRKHPSAPVVIATPPQ